MSDRDVIHAALTKLVNLAPRELELFLGGEAAIRLGPGAIAEGRAVAALLRTPKAQLQDEDWAVVTRVTHDLQARLAERPEGDIEHSSWRLELMCRGHDPLTWTAIPTPSAAIATSGPAGSLTEVRIRGAEANQMLAANRAALAPRDLRYLGLIGSRAKVARIYDALTADRMPAETLQRVHAPIGLDIGAVTPQEIAVSILAELIAVKHGKRHIASMQWAPPALRAEVKSTKSEV